jgi:hypothetical protein
MMIADTLRAWVLMVASAEPFTVETEGHRGTELLEHLLGVTEEPNEVVLLLGAAIGSFLWEVQHAAAEACWDDAQDLSLRKDVLEGIPRLLQAACAIHAGSDAVFQFWDSFLAPWDREHRGNHDHPLVESVANALLEQLAGEQDECLQMSALHGINHLRDLNTVNAAKALLLSPSPQVQEYAGRALAFRAP